MLLNVSDRIVMEPPSPENLHQVTPSGRVRHLQQEDHESRVCSHPILMSLPAQMEPRRLIVVHHSITIVISETDQKEVCLAKPKLLHELNVSEVLWCFESTLGWTALAGPTAAIFNGVVNSLSLPWDKVC